VTPEPPPSCLTEREGEGRGRDGWAAREGGGGFRPTLVRFVNSGLIAQTGSAGPVLRLTSEGPGTRTWGIREGWTVRKSEGKDTCAGLARSPFTSAAQLPAGDLPPVLTSLRMSEC